MSDLTDKVINADSQLDSPAIISRYKEHSILASSATGKVWKAFDEHLNRNVAIKQIVSDVSRKHRINAEVKLMVFLNHPSILRLLDIVQDKKFVYVIQPFCENGTLEQWLSSEVRKISKRSQVFLQLLSAVNYLHAQKWIHGDIKSTNVFLDDREQPFLSDFGNATYLEKDSQYSGKIDTTWTGTIGYMAPELLRHESAPTVASDIYALGVLLYELLSGKKPFSSDPNAAVQAILNSRLPKLKGTELSSLADWNWVIQRATAASPSDRYCSADEFARDVQRIELNMPLLTQPPSRINQAIKWTRREPLVAWLSLSTVALACIGLTVSLAAWSSASSYLADIQKEREKLNEASQQVQLTQAKWASLIEEGRIATEEANAQEAEAQKTIQAIANLETESQKEIIKGVELAAATETALDQNIQQLTSSLESANRIEEDKRTIVMKEQIRDAQAKLEELLLQRYKRDVDPNATPTEVQKGIELFSLVTSILKDNAPAGTVNKFLQSLDSESPPLKSVLKNLASKATKEKDWKAKTKLAAIELHAGSLNLATEMLRYQPDSSPEQRTAFIENFHSWPGDISVLAKRLENVSDGFFRSGICLALGRGTPPDQKATSEWQPTFEKWFAETEYIGATGAAEWVMKQWKLPLPDHIVSNDKSNSNTIRRTPSGVTLIRVPAGQYDVGTQQPDVRNVREFWISEKEITWGQFRQMIEDPEYIAYRTKLSESGVTLIPLPSLPQASQNPHPALVNWHNTMEFCNWMSRREGLSEAYERTGETIKYFPKDANKPQNFLWQRTETGIGYRLASVRAWSYAALSGSRGKYCFGDDASFLDSYCFSKANSNAVPSFEVGSKMCNAWGLFDMHGNAPEWTDYWGRPGFSFKFGGGTNVAPEECTANPPKYAWSYNDSAGIRISIVDSGNMDPVFRKPTDTSLPRVMANNNKPALPKLNNKIHWAKRELSSSFYGEGGTITDLDADGQMDIVAGPLAYFGPDFSRPIQIRPANPISVVKYSDYWLVFDHDIDGDGNTDLLIAGFPGTSTYWYRNPGKVKCRLGNWERFVVLDNVENESPTFTDITGDGRPELICGFEGRYGYAQIPNVPSQKWTFRPITAKGQSTTFAMGLGVGDINDDGRKDLITKDGWWEQPADLTTPEWTLYRVPYAASGGAQMIVADLDGDQQNELVSSLTVHDFGLGMFKKKLSKTESKWTRQNITTDQEATSPTGLAISQLHALELADIDGDGQVDILTGSRFWTHTGSVGEYEPSKLVWFKPITSLEGLQFVPNIIDENSGAGTQIVARDVNADGRVDILSVSKRGIFLFTQTDSPSEKPKGQSPRDQSDIVADQVIKINDSLGGYRPAWSDTEPMNLDFEKGDLRDWYSKGSAFFKQPFGKNQIPEIRKPLFSNSIPGEYFIGGYEIVEDQGVGTLTSLPFMLKYPWISYLMSGGSKEVQVEILDHASQKVLYFSSGNQSEKLERVVVDAKDWLSKIIAVRLSDGSREGWGHINFDDFRIHENKPAVEIRTTPEANTAKKANKVTPNPKDNESPVGKARSEIAKLESRLNELQGKFDFNVHNGLRHNYGVIGSEKWIYHMEMILENLVMEPYMLKILSGHNPTPTRQIETLISNARKHQKNELIVAACYLQVSRLSKDPKQGIEYAEKVLSLNSNKTAPYQKLAEARRTELQ